MKICSKCHIEKPFSQFHKRNTRPCGYVSHCIECKAIARKNHYSLNQDKELVMNRKWKEENYESILEYAKNYKTEHREHFTMLENIRRSKQVSSSILNGDEWNDFVNEEIYELRKIRSDETKIEWHVDHIVPLQGKNVSGLHVWYNLQLLPAKMNLQKSNIH